MSEKSKLNYTLVSLTLLGVFIFFYLLLYQKPIHIQSASSFFTMAVVGSFCFYVDFFRKDSQSNFYWVGMLISLNLLSILGLFPNLSSLITLLWLFGCAHFILHILLASKDRGAGINYFCLYVSLPLYILLSNYFLALNGTMNPLVQDEFLMAIDGSLGIYPSLMLGRFIRALPQSLTALLNCLYVALPLAFIFLYQKKQKLDGVPPYELMIEPILIGIIGYTLYHFIPGCGSTFAFHETWPDSLPLRFLKEGPQLIYCPTNLPRNCLPSLHIAWIICLLRQAFLCDPLSKVLVLFFAFANVIAVFGIGAHYFVDLVVGLAFANCIGGIAASQVCLQNKARYQAILMGGLLCASWYALILYGIPLLQSSKILAWSVFLASILSSLYLERRLFQALAKNETFSIGLLKIAGEPEF